jgi:hypothetical protein
MVPAKRFPQKRFLGPKSRFKTTRTIFMEVNIDCSGERLLSVHKILYYYIILKTDIGNHLDLRTIWTWEPYGPGNVFDRNHMDLGVLLTGTYWPRTYISRNLFGGNLFGRNVSVGTSGSLEPFSQELFLRECFGRNLLVGIFWQEPIETPPMIIIVYGSI